MVENELPLASVVVPSSTSTSTIDKRLRISQSNINSNDTQIQDVNEIVSESVMTSGNISLEQQKHMSSGSYNNLLYRENPNEIKEDKKNVDLSQNVYSNIPPTSPSVPNILKNAASDHVYSNIDETVNGGNGYMSDNLDLDLDDPLTSLTSSFIKKKEIPNNQVVYNTSSSSTQAIVPIETHNTNKIILPSISSSSSTTGTQITSIELKNVLNAVALQKSSNQLPINEVPVIGPALRQETMIDTALDLDSLDSQVGLMNKK